MRVLLIQPRERDGVGFKRLSAVEPLALEIIAACLEDKHEVRIHDLIGEGDRPDTVTAVVESFQPDVVGITCTFTIDVYQALRIARLAKQASKKPFVIVGGHHASLNSGDFQDAAVDAICIGEGEVTAPETLECLETGGDLTQVQGLAINTPNGQVFTEARPLVPDLDAIPFPARHLTAQYRGKYYLSFDKPVATIQTARGCPYKCNFCSVWTFYRGMSRTKSPERVVAELATIDEKDILIADDNFTLNIARAKDIAGKLKESGIRKRYTCQARSDTIVKHPEIVELWKHVGLVGVFMGFEKINAEEMAAINKRNEPENNDRALKIIQSHGIAVIASFIVDPGYEHDDFEKLRRYVQKRRIEAPWFSVLTPLPGTELFAQVRDRLATTNYELFDLLHTVMPTKLDLPDFYKEYASLYKVAYSRTRVLSHGFLPFMRNLFAGRVSIGHVRKIAGLQGMVSDPAVYLADHDRPPMLPSEVVVSSV